MTTCAPSSLAHLHTFLTKKLSIKPGSADPNGGTAEGNDPLRHGEHTEFNSSPSRRQVQRGVYGRLTWR